MTPQERNQFIERIAPWARFSQEKYGVPASVTLAQAILESNWGKSLLAAKYNNFFGIKDSQLSNDGYAELPTTEVENGNVRSIRARFEAFADPQRAFDCHARLLARLPRYKPAMADADDPFVFAARVQECGYSTDPAYAKKLVDVITANKLTRFDAPKKAGS